MTIFQVAQMHNKFGFEALDKPGFLAPELMKLRLNFLLEELKETADACGYQLVLGAKKELEFDLVHNKVNLEEAFDGLLDLEVVTHGTAHLMGLMSHVPADVKSKYATIWSEGKERVFKANMSKERVAKGQVGKRGSSHDLIKPKGWKAPEFKDLLK